MPDQTCEKCGRAQPAGSTATQCVYCGVALPVPEAEAAVPAAPAPEAPAAATAEEPVPEGKRRCTGCGEVLYAEERRCWRCGVEVAAPALVAPAAPVPVAPVAAPPIAAPPAPTPPPYVPPAAPVAPTPPVDAAAQTLGIWALVLALLGLLSCPPVITSIIAIVLAVKSKQKGGSALAIAGLVIGLIGLVIYVPVVALLILGALSPGTPTTPTPETTSWLWSVSCLFS